MGVSIATFYNWKKKYCGLGVLELRGLKSMEDENSQLKKTCGRFKSLQTNPTSCI